MLCYCMFMFHCLHLISKIEKELPSWYLTANIWFLTVLLFFLPDGNLYAVGGYDSSSHLATVEKYDPQVKSILLHLSSK